MHIERLAHCLALAEAMSQSHCYHLLACAGQLTYPGTDTGEPFPGDPVWAGLSVTREMSSVILPLAHPLILNLLSLSLSLCMHAYSDVQSCPTLWTPWTIIHQAPLSMDFPGKNTGAGCHFLLQGSFRSRDPTLVSCIGRHILYHWATWESSLPPSRSDSLQIYQVFPKATKPLLFSGQSEEDYGRCRVSTARIKSSAEEGVCSQLGAILQVPAASETWGISPLKVKC